MVVGLNKTQHRLLRQWAKSDGWPSGVSKSMVLWDFHILGIPSNKYGHTRTYQCLYCDEQLRLIPFAPAYYDSILAHREACQVQKDFAIRMMLYPVEEE